MATRSVIRSVLFNYLETFTSRYSDWRGYWVFGFLAADWERLNDIDCLDFDLLKPTADSQERVIIAYIRELAVTKFQDQLSKARLAPSSIREAKLAIERMPGMLEVPVNGRPTVGRQVRFSILAVTDLARAYRCEKIIAVAPHNPAVERGRHTLM
jgi:hypothetical protein